MYILRINEQSYIEDFGECEDKILLSRSYRHAFGFKTIGEAMRKAAQLNEQIDTPIIKIVRVDD